ncbi:hypothetical protein IQ238_23775 [Pleurocapsales cyanobacterium LEGE 06147]|nr:hypothetical protein [Pleurocapsales cyanobacterium LEGE 06147]
MLSGSSNILEVGSSLTTRWSGQLRVFSSIVLADLLSLIFAVGLLYLSVRTAPQAYR